MNRETWSMNDKPWNMIVASLDSLNPEGAALRLDSGSMDETVHGSRNKFGKSIHDVGLCLIPWPRIVVRGKLLPGSMDETVRGS